MMDRRLRYVQTRDVADIVQIDQLAFPGDAWSARSYHFEINESTVSYMAVLEQWNPNPRPLTAIQRLLKPLFDHDSENYRHWGVLGYAGLWCIDDEAHISTIATHPDHRGNGYGEILFLGMCRRAFDLGASYIVLEVRVSNAIAQNLYRKHGFEVTMTKRKYYRSNGEDAYDMRLDLTDAGRVEQLEQAYQVLQQRLPFEDLYSQTPHPRLGK